MSDLLKFESGDSEIYVEVERREPVVRGRAADRITEAGQDLEKALSQLQPLITALVTQLSGASNRPDELTVEFGFTLTSDANLVIARAGGGANFRVALTWKRDRPWRKESPTTTN